MSLANYQVIKLSHRDNMEKAESCWLYRKRYVSVIGRTCY